MTPEEYSFTRYLAAKKNVDDRALNRQVLQVLGDSLQELSHARPLKVLEIGAGIGTMFERMVDWGFLSEVEYTAIDSEAENIINAQQRIQNWAARNNLRMVKNGNELKLSSNRGEILVKLLAVNLFDFLELHEKTNSCDLLIAHAFLDLVDIPKTLPRIFGLARGGGLFYFSINYDGLTVLQPTIDQKLDQQVLELYHRTMEERTRNNYKYGDRYAGRNLFQHIQHAGGHILASGSSDWIVHPGAAGYSGDESYFLHFIIQTIHQALEDHPDLDSQTFSNWIRQRHEQVDRQELVYIAHQIDHFGICP
jgi:SAM-dependent methyltransferase